MTTMRKVKNVVNNYTPAQVKVREATSNDPWGPSSSVMSEIADLTYNVVAFSEIMSMIWKRLNDHGKNWRHVYKALMLLEYIIKTGSERVAQQCKENIFAIQTLKDFQFTDRDGKDQGMNVREKSKNLVLLLKDDERLKTERTRALKAKERFAQASQGIGSDASPTGTGTATDGTSPDQNGTSGDGDFKLRPELNRALTERCHPRDSKALRDKHVKSSHHKKRSKSMSKDRAKSDDNKYKEPEGTMTSTGAIMIPVTQQYWWRAGADSDVADSDFDDEIISASSGTPPLTRDLSSEIEQARPQTTGEEELQLQLALAMSREEADEKKKMERSDDVRLQIALSESIDQNDEPGDLAGGASTLLNIAGGPQMTPANSDPWGAPSSGPPPTSDPWGSTAPTATANMPAIPNDPWAGQPNPAHPPATTGSDPWAPPAPVSADPWSGSPTNIPPVQPASDPWNSTSNQGQPAPPSDPWGATKPADPDAEFDMLRTAGAESPQLGFGDALQPSQPAGDAFSMSGMSNALSAEQQRKKSPKDFLGENSSLVNLDSLISPAPQPTVAPANPFMGITQPASTTTSTSAAAANPFHQQRQPAPTINQIRSQPAGNMMGGGGVGMSAGVGAGGGTALQQPLMPMGVAMTPLVPQSQPTQQTNNPFLM